MWRPTTSVSSCKVYWFLFYAWLAVVNEVLLVFLVCTIEWLTPVHDGPVKVMSKVSLPKVPSKYHAALLMWLWWCQIAVSFHATSFVDCRWLQLRSVERGSHDQASHSTLCHWRAVHLRDLVTYAAIDYFFLHRQRKHPNMGYYQKTVRAFSNTEHRRPTSKW